MISELLFYTGVGCLVMGVVWAMMGRARYRQANEAAARAIASLRSASATKGQVTRRQNELEYRESRISELEEDLRARANKQGAKEQFESDIPDPSTRRVVMALLKTFPDGRYRALDGGRVVKFGLVDGRDETIAEVDIQTLDAVTQDGFWHGSGAMMSAVPALIADLQSKAGEDFSPPARASSVDRGS